jgi:hypothetical protein
VDPSSSRVKALSDCKVGTMGGILTLSCQWDRCFNGFIFIYVQWTHSAQSMRWADGQNLCKHTLERNESLITLSSPYFAIRLLSARRGPTMWLAPWIFGRRSFSAERLQRMVIGAIQSEKLWKTTGYSQSFLGKWDPLLLWREQLVIGKIQEGLIWEPYEGRLRGLPFVWKMEES